MTTHDTRWTASAACASRLDLPWTTDRANVTPWAALSMTAVCESCPVLAACRTAVDALDVTGGWWAGADRDPDATDPTDLVPVTWRTLRTRTGQTVGAQGAFDLDAMAGAGSMAGAA